MKKTTLMMLLLLAVISFITGCSGETENSQPTPASVTVIPLIVGEELPQYQLRVAHADSILTYSYGEAEQEYLYTLEVVELREPERADHTLQLFTVSSTIDDANELISVFDINHDKYSDIIVRTYQTPHSAAWYRAYRWLPKEGRFEAEPFFEYLCSDEPTLVNDNQLLTYDITLTNYEIKLYELGQNGEYFLLRIMNEERYNRCVYTVTQAESGEVLYSCEYGFDQTVPPEEIIRISGFLIYGEDYSDDKAPFLEFIPLYRGSERKGSTH